jgi:hypothetical protein
LTASGEHHSVGRSAEQLQHRRKILILRLLKTIEYRLAGFARVTNFAYSRRHDSQSVFFRRVASVEYGWLPPDAFRRRPARLANLEHDSD